MIEVKIAKSSEYELLAKLGRRAFQEAFGEYNDPADMQTYLDLAFNPETILKQLEDSDVTYLIAFYQGDAVGYAKLNRNSSPPELEKFKCIQLERIYSLMAFIGKKIGKNLMQECLRIAKEEQFEKIWLSVWQENHRAIEFYKKWNFRIIGYKKFIIGKEVNDDYIMALDVK